MDRLGDHPNIVQIFELCDEDQQSYMVLPVIASAGVEGLIKAVPSHGVLLEWVVAIAKDSSRGWSLPTPRASSTGT